MKFSDLKNIESSLNPLHGNVEAFDIKCISHADDPRPETFIFIKSKKFLENIGRRSQTKNYTNCGILIEESVASLIEEDDFSYLKKDFAWIASIENVSNGMCSLTKPFYDEMYAEINFQADGRTLGEADIDPSAEIATTAFIGSHVKIGKNVRILPGCVLLPHTSVGDNTILFPNVTLYPFTQIGKSCRIHAGTVIGCDGFGYNFIDGEHKKIWHLYGVLIKDEVEIGCNTMIDNGAFIETTIGSRTRIDNDVQISHNVLIGENVVICGKTGLAGSVEVSDFCAFGAQSGVAPAARLGKGVQVAARGAVSENARVEPGLVVAGHPARPLKEWLRGQAALRKLTKK